ncbi:hypothetical protein N7516_006346 [Penicillium verrucosum]|uniref:uncharacterized protein n=1 Tax=Penicillium verrucosum TaxID=60171 RepID=UPI00254514D2|nr:uncharacterized protein N7516_006346 [Penicillium verrucosum]KAJ5931857.1 hypothetical protein N7516_006346 [Penicillium verrucosum]
MTNLEQGHQTPAVCQSTLGSSVRGVENGASTVTADTAYDAEDNNAKEVSNGNEACFNDQNLRVPNARHWNSKYKLFVSFSAISSYFVMWVNVFNLAVQYRINLT